MQPFQFSTALNSQSAISNFNSATEYLAGGTTLMDLMKLHVMTPTKLVDLTALPLKSVIDTGSHIEVGALVTNSEMAYHPLIISNFPFISEALLSGASPQLRNMATTAGNILQKTRCAYFRDQNAKCNKRDPGAGCDALKGVNRMHAILGTSDQCIAAHPSDLCVALMAAGATLNTESKNGNRKISFENFYVMPGENPSEENVLTTGELITSISIPKSALFKRSTYVKIRDRASYAFALCSAAVAIELKNNQVLDIRIAMGGIGTIPWRAKESEKILIGRPLSLEIMRDAAHALVKEALPRKYNSFKVPLAEQTLIRALKELEQKA